MRTLTVLAVLLLALAATGSSKRSEPPKAAQPGAEASSWSGGDALSVAQATPLSDLSADPARFVGQTLRLEGTVTGVCKGSGCWVEVTDAAGNAFIARSLDHSIAFPKDCEGKTAIVQGEIVLQPGTGEQHAHAEGEAAHECPAPKYMMALAAAALR